MPINPLGSGVSRFINDRDRQYAAVVFQASKPPLDSELNLISLIDLEAKAEEVRSRVASGWLMDELNPRSDYFTSTSYSNQFYFGKNNAGETRNISWAVVNGWAIPVAGTKTGSPPLAANNLDYWNRICLNPPSTSTGGNRAEFVFLEVWLQRVDIDPAPPAVAPGKPQRGFVYKFGNVEGGFTALPDELVDPDINYETTKRVQIQYRIRVVADVNLVSNPEGFDSSLVFAQGALPTPSIVPFTNMRGELGDPGLWRAGTGDPATFGTADGYVYAIPICSVFRRNAAGFSDIGNLAGGFNRNSKALYRTDAVEYTNSIVLPANITSTATTFNLTSIAGTVLSTMSSFGEAYFRIDDEIVRVVSIVQVTPTNFAINIDRGQLNTIARSHLINTELKLHSVRPDGLFADQVSATDILDLRHSVADKFDYDTILKTNVVELLKGNLRSTWKRWGTTNTAGSVVLYGDRITDSSIFVGGLTRLDAPDGNRRVFSDASVTQRFVIPVSVPTTASNLNDEQQVTVEPYTGVIKWTGAPGLHGPGANRNNGSLPYWWNGDQLSVQILPYQAGLPASDINQVRFVLPTEITDSVIVRFDGMTTDPNGGNPATVLPVLPTAPTATDPDLTNPITGNRILKNGQGLSVSLDGNGNLLITLASGTINNPLQEWIDAIQGETVAANVQRYKMYVEFTVQYGTGRGLSHKPDWVHQVQYRGTPTNVTKTLTRSGLPTLSPMIPTYLVDSPFIQTGNNRTYAKTSEVMLDPGSKTAYIAPYRQIEVPALVARNGDHLNWYGPLGANKQGSMPALDQSGLSTVNPNVDPLGLFFNKLVTRYVEVPLEYLPRPGFHYVPVVPVTDIVYSSGINFLMMSSQGALQKTSFFNVNYVSYPANSPGWYVVTPKVGETYGTSSGNYSMFGAKVSIPAASGPNGKSFRGIKFPPFMGPARITGVYARSGNAVVPTSSPFNNDRIFIGGIGSDTNLLRDSFDGPTFLLDVDQNGDLYFILNAEVIDLTKAASGTTFDNTEFLIECTLFGYDRGFLQTNGRILCARAGATSISIEQTVGTYLSTDFSLSSLGLIVPAPLSAGAANNEVTFYYSRSPYQGDPFGTQNAYSDDFYRLGPLAVNEASTLAASPLGPVSTLSLPNKSGFEVLSAVSFVTSLGTGRLSGSNPIPLLNTTEAPQNPPDYAGTWVDLDRNFSLNRVGFDDWASPKFPVTSSSLASRPPTVVGALSEVFDNDVHPEFAGCTVQLPLGAYFRDKDFAGKTLYQARSTNGIGNIPVGTLLFTNYEASMTKGVDGLSTWEGRDYACGQASNTSGVGTEAIVRVDGTSSVASTTVFKTTRGGAAYSASGPWPGGLITSRFIKTRPNTEVGAVLMCTAYLVRSSPESVSGVEIHPGHELQMIIVTQAAPSYFRDNEIVHSASGSNEGYTAVDRYRLLGKPIEKRRGNVRTDVLPAGKPLFVNKIYDNPLLFGSSDLPLISSKQESLAVTANGQVNFTLSSRPLDPTTVQMFVNGVKMQYGVDFTVAGITNTTVTYNPNPPLRPALLTTDVVDFIYLLF
jgi:hypothetical protein